MGVKINLPFEFLIETAGRHLHIRCDISAVAGTLTGINRVKMDQRCKVDNAWHTATVKAGNIAIAVFIKQGEEVSDFWIIGEQDIVLLSKADRLVEQKDHAINTLWNLLVLDHLICFINRIVPQHIVNIGFDPFFHQHFDGFQGVGTPIPANGDCTAVGFYDICLFVGEAEA